MPGHGVRVVVDNAKTVLLGKAVEHAAKGADEVKNRDLDSGVGLLIGRRGSGFRAGEEPAVLLALAQGEEACGILEFFVFDKLSDEIPAWVVFLGVFLGRAHLTWQQHAALDIHQRGGHDNELGGEFDVEKAKGVDCLEVLSGDAADGYVVDVQLLFPNQIEEEVERALENVEFDFVGVVIHKGGIMACSRAPASEILQLLAAISACMGSDSIAYCRTNSDRGLARTWFSLPWVFRSRHMKPEDNPYSQEMREWLRRQSLWGRMLSHFGSGSMNRGCLVSLVLLPVIVVLGLFTWYMLVTRYLDSGDFARLLRQEAAVVAGADRIVATTGKWEGGVLSMTGVRGEGGPGSWLRGFEAGTVEVRLSLTDLLSEEWEPQTVAFERLDLDIRAGMLNEEEAETLRLQQELRREERLAGEEAVVEAGRYGINLNPEGFSARRFVGRDSTFRWGGDPSRGGVLSGTDFEAVAVDGGWQMVFRGGVLQQGWVENLQLERAEVIVSRGQLQIVSAGALLLNPMTGEAFGGAGAELSTTPEHGVPVRFSGTVTLGVERPAVDLSWRFEDVPLSHLLHGDGRGLFSGDVSGEVRMSGFFNDAAGLVSRGEFVFAPGFGFTARAHREIDVLQVFASRLPELRVPYIDATSGRARFEHSRRSLAVESFSWNAPSTGRIEGSLNVATREGRIEGVVRVGLPPQVLERRPWLIEEGVFGSPRDGLSWTEVPVGGVLNQCTAEAAEALRELLRRHE